MIKDQIIRMSTVAFKLLRLETSWRANILLAFWMVILYACSQKADHPAGILSQEQMAKAMTEFYLNDAKITTLSLHPDSALNMFQLFKQKYEEENSLSDSLLEESYQYYLGSPSELSEIYDRIIDSLALAEQRTGINMKKAE